jgi:hypothetical protein
MTYFTGFPRLVAVLERADVGQEHAARCAGREADLGADLVGDAGYLLERQDGQVVPPPGQGDHPSLLARPAVARWAGPGYRLWPPTGLLAVGSAGAGRRGLPAGCDRAFLQRPPAELGKGGRGSDGESQQPQNQAADDRHGCGLVVGQRLPGLAGTGDGAGPDDADEGV